jgi:mRNA-degrading endonuclease YafQ of YafQ-DinJ toxin-antitoxin module
MRVVFSQTFQANYQALPSDIQKRVDKAIRFLASKEGSKPFHPSLRARRIKGTADIWEASVTMKYRLTFQIHEDVLYLRVVGDHDPTLKNP